MCALLVGDAALSFSDTTLAAETCEELFTPRAPHIALSLSGIEIISNGSGSHHQLRYFKQTAVAHRTDGRSRSSESPVHHEPPWRYVCLATLILCEPR